MTSPGDQDQSLVLMGWWLVRAPAIVVSLAIIWGPIAIFGINMTHWRANALWIELGAFFAAFVASSVWKKWSSPRWVAWAYSRASDIDAVKVQAMKEGLIPKENGFLSDLPK